MTLQENIKEESDDEVLNFLEDWEEISICRFTFDSLTGNRNKYRVTMPRSVWRLNIDAEGDTIEAAIIEAGRQLAREKQRTKRNHEVEKSINKAILGLSKGRWNVEDENPFFYIDKEDDVQLALYEAWRHYSRYYKVD